MFRCILFEESSSLDIIHVEKKGVPSSETNSLEKEKEREKQKDKKTKQEKKRNILVKQEFRKETKNKDIVTDMRKKNVYSIENSKYKETRACPTKSIKRMVNELHNTFISIEDSFCPIQTKEILGITKIKKKKNEINKLPDLHINMNKYVDIGGLGFWTVSSFKKRFGLNNLKDDNPCTFWQTTSIGPHTLTIQFSKLMKISKLFLLFNYLLDESYTPYEIEVNIGSDENHLKSHCKTYCVMKNYSVNDYFWFAVDVTKKNPSFCMHNFEKNYLKKKSYIYARCLQIAILSNQHNGRDTRIRQVKLFGPKCIPLSINK